MENSSSVGWPILPRIYSLLTCQPVYKIEKICLVDAKCHSLECYVDEYNSSLHVGIIPIMANLCMGDIRTDYSLYCDKCRSIINYRQGQPRVS
jgi:hypothetical protein